MNNTAAARDAMLAKAHRMNQWVWHAQQTWTRYVRRRYINVDELDAMGREDRLEYLDKVRDLHWEWRIEDQGRQFFHPWFNRQIEGSIDVTLDRVYQYTYGLDGRPFRQIGPGRP